MSFLLVLPWTDSKIINDSKQSLVETWPVHKIPMHISEHRCLSDAVAHNVISTEIACAGTIINYPILLQKAYPYLRKTKTLCTLASIVTNILKQ